MGLHRVSLPRRRAASIHTPRVGQERPSTQRAVPLLDAGGDVRPLDDIVRDVVRCALAHTGSVSDAARLLRVGRSSIYRWLKRGN